MYLKMLLLPVMLMISKMRMNRKIKDLMKESAPVLLSFLGLASSCSQSSDEAKEHASVDTASAVIAPVLSAEDQLYKEVMDIHDQAMEGMSVIRRLSLQLSDSIENTGVNPMEQEEAINLYRNRLQDLKAADEAMRQWMRSFDYKNVADSAQLQYLLSEKEKIEKVDSQMHKAISSAREAMKK
jgi:hypothetical protein